jgi:hypothetical protein
MGARAPMRPPAVPNYYKRAMWARDHVPNAKEGRAHLDVTGDCHKLYLGTHVCNSAGWTSTMLLDPRATPDKGIC